MTSSEDVSFLWADIDLTEIVDKVNWTVEELYVPKHDTLYVIVPEYVRDGKHVEIVSVPDEIYDHEDYIAEWLCENEKFKKYILNRSEYGLAGYFYSDINVYPKMFDFFRDRPDFLYDYHDFMIKNKRKQTWFDREFYKYCALKLLKSEDWFAFDIRRLGEVKIHEFKRIT